MNILFPTISTAIRKIDNRGIYPDLVRKLAVEGHHVYVIFPIDKKERLYKNDRNNIHQLGLPFTRITKAPLYERIWSMWRISSVFEGAINKHWSNIDFDLILYATPPITFNRLIAKLKKRHGASTFLMLKDIFPQNAVDLGMLSKNNPAYWNFKKQEEKLYAVSDKIGCMSQANVDYLLESSNKTLKDKLLICPNSMEIKNKPLVEKDKCGIRERLKIPKDKVVTVYGGNLGKPQGISFLKKILIHFREYEKVHFVICGSGTEAINLELFIGSKRIRNVSFFKEMERADYDLLEASADMALVFLDARFTIPNYPSRILSYMEHALPILFSVDDATDVGTDAEEGGYGFSTRHGDLKGFSEAFNRLTQNPELRYEMGRKGREYLLLQFTVDKTYRAIMGGLIQTNDV